MGKASAVKKRQKIKARRSEAEIKRPFRARHARKKRATHAAGA
jgi:hypothetical protein